MEKENKEEEPEVITFKEISERHKDIKEEELFKLVLVCKNCGHKDLLGNFIKKKDKWRDLIKPKEPYEPKPYKPNSWKQIPYNPGIKPRWNGGNKITCSNNKKIMMAMRMDSIDYEDFFFCPKCRSSLIVLCPEFVKNNIIRVMEDEK